jgi:hypothetical protein
MWRAVLTASIVAGLGACGGSAAKADAGSGSPDAADLRAACGDVSAQWSDVVRALDRRCTSSAACFVPDDCHGCYTFAYLGAFGPAVNRGAYGASAAPDLASQFHEQCDKLWEVADCGAATVECVAGACTITGRECCGCPRVPDAGP